MKTKVAVVCVTYNSEHEIAQLLSSMGRSGCPAPVIVVDNASSDGTTAVVAAFPGVRLITNSENRWLSPAMVQGLVAAGSVEWILFTNPDVEFLTPNWLSQMVSFGETHQDIAIIGPRLLDTDGDVQFSGHARRSTAWVLSTAAYLTAIASKLGFRRDWRWRPEWRRDSTEDVPVLSGAVMLIRVDWLRAAGGIDTSFRLYFEEDDLCCRAADSGMRVVLLGSVEAVHHWARSTAQVDPSLLQKLGEDSLLRYARKHEGIAVWVVALGLRRAMNTARKIVVLLRAHAHQ